MPTYSGASCLEADQVEVKTVQMCNFKDKEKYGISFNYENMLLKHCVITNYEEFWF